MVSLSGVSCTCVYAFNYNYKRLQLWMELCQIGHLTQERPWLIMGYFNCVINPDERVGLKVRQSEMVDFRGCVDAC